MSRTSYRPITVIIAITLALVAGIGLGAAGWAHAHPADAGSPDSTANTSSETNFGTSTQPFYGAHQPGIKTPAQAQATFAALDLRADTDLAGVGRLMRAWTTDIAKLMSGEPITGDTASALARFPADLTVTVGYGHSLFEKTGITDRWPLSVSAIPAYPIDRLQDRWSDGDIVLQICGNDPIANFHALHQLLRTATPFATLRWEQRGFLHSAGVNVDEVGRNLFGQVDGTANAAPGTPEFDGRTWASSPADFAGGTSLVVRRIEFAMDKWDRLSDSNKDKVIGRSLEDGSPLSGGDASTPMDLEKADASGAPLIPDHAHARLSFTSENEGITRRGYNYDDGTDADAKRQVGLIFASYQESVDRYLRIQEALAGVDSLNTWTTPIGSALFAIPPGVAPGGWIGQSLLE